VPPRQRGSTGDSDTPRSPRIRSAADVKGAEDVVEETSRAGRSTADGGTGGSPVGASTPPARTDPLVTLQTGQPGGTPTGRPTRVRPEDDAPTQRSIELENSGAVTLAARGWQVQQNPTPDEVTRARQESGDTGAPQSNPDYLLEGRVFDAYSPTNPARSVRNIWSEVEDKVVDRAQTQRVVINLEDWRGDMSRLRQQFADWPIPGLKEVKAITPDGDIVQIDLP
jgi:hypothetical protein